jgi:hypothetical protein
VATAVRASSDAAVDLYWIPLGAGNRCVRFNGRVYDAVGAAIGRRPRSSLFHSALVVELDGEPHAIEVGPSPDADLAARGVVATGPVGSRCLGRLRLFRYEVRRWRGGAIPDLAEAVGGPCRLTADPRPARRLIDVVATVPTLVWGRDELGAGEMWNSNSVIAWALARAGIATEGLAPPDGGRAPGWGAGLELARRAGRTTPGQERPSASSRRAAMTSGAGGQPGMRRSTGSTASSAPAISAGSPRTPQPSAQSPSAATSRGSGMAA